MKQRMRQHQAQHGMSYTNEQSVQTAMPSAVVRGDEHCQNGGSKSMSLDIATPSLFSTPHDWPEQTTPCSTPSGSRTKQTPGIDTVGDNLTSDWYYHANEPGPSTMKRRVDSGLSDSDTKDSRVAMSNDDADNDTEMEVSYVGKGKGKMGEGVELICID
jgi:hypothetical protein